MKMIRMNKTMKMKKTSIYQHGLWSISYDIYYVARKPSTNLYVYDVVKSLHLVSTHLVKSSKQYSCGSLWMILICYML